MASSRSHRLSGHRVLGHRVLGHRVLGHRVLGHRVLGHRVLGNWVLLPVAAALIAGGCSSHVPDRVAAPDIDPSGSAAKAMSMYDTNHDGVLSPDELKKCPAIKNALKGFTGPDGKVTADSIAAELQRIKDTKIGISPVELHVTLDGKDLSGATVTLEPEPFMPSIAPASGVTNAQGFVSPVIDPQARPRGVNPGLYKIRITKVVNGKETIPARYNKDTELGIEIAQSNKEIGENSKLELKSRE